MTKQFSDKTKIFYLIYIALALNIVFPIRSYGANNQKSCVLIISSYNPEASNTAKNISAFIDEYKSLGGQLPVAIENMNCGSFSDAYLWEGNMNEILGKYLSVKNSPALIILLGQEAWSSYISLDKNMGNNKMYNQVHALIHKTPVMCGMVSKNAIILPNDNKSLENWEPKSVDMLKDIPQIYQMSGYVYQYDIKKNVRLIRDLYPKTKHIALITDNTYGGVCLQALVKKEMKLFPQLDLILLDGRKSSIYTIVDQINSLPSNSVILLGTWRVDKNNGYFMNNAIYMMMGANPKIPAFTLTSIGLGHWAIGGNVPQYRSLGKEMASQAYEMLENNNTKKAHVEFIPNRYTFDVQKLNELKISVDKLPKESAFVNEEPSFFERYERVVWGAVALFFVLLTGCLVSLYYLIRTKKLKDELEVSEADLRVAKEKAEESERLKSAFLANMTHEIRTPLNAIVGFSNILAMGGCAQEDVIEYNKVIQSNTDLLLRLINDILDISRLESGKLDFFYEECNVTSLCKEALASVESVCENPVKFIFNTQNPDFYLVTDIHRLQQVLLNLLSNSNKFTKKGSIVLEFRIDEKQQMAFFAVTDTGAGIPEGNEELVFDRFKKLNDFIQGTGLGLAICKTIMSALGGDIWVDSDYKDGARFVFSHPLGLHPQEFINE